MSILTDFRSLEAYSQEREIAVPAAQEEELTPGGIELSTLWQLLMAGEIRIVETFSVDERAFVALAPGRGENAAALPSPFDRLIVERIFEGECPKVLAPEIRLSVSSLATRCANALAAIGCHRSISRASALVSMAALASRGIPLGRARVDGGGPPWLVSVANPAESLRDRLSPSEYEVARYSVDGQCQAEIATARGVSQRTVANQIGAVFRKLELSGRGELRAFAIRAQAQRLKGCASSNDDQARQVSQSGFFPTSPSCGTSGRGDAWRDA
jgi:DNA-binding CsgD family transcriptional regulator